MAQKALLPTSVTDQRLKCVNVGYMAHLWCNSKVGTDTCTGNNAGRG